MNNYVNTFSDESIGGHGNCWLTSTSQNTILVGINIHKWIWYQYIGNSFVKT